jgi:hypothetical protein
MTLVIQMTAPWIPWSTTGRQAGYMLGNEVAFDDVAAFNRAMASPVRQELRAHFRPFPPFSGANTHYPMRRTRLIGP